MRISVHDIVKEFGRSAALNGVTLEIASGELMALLGPSGSGKTTLLRVIAGLEIPTSGAVYFGEEDASFTPVQERGVGFVFQHYALFRHLTVFENIAFGLRVRGRKQRPGETDIKRKVRELLELVQLSDYEKRYPNQLSGGQRQRVALARALAVDPKVLLLDEPFGALDAKVRKDLRRWLRDLHRRTGHTTIFVTHDQDEALELADRVALLNAGRIEQAGTPEEIYDQPASPFVFSFIGESHSVPVELRGGVAFLGETPLAIPAEGDANGRATLYLRPQDVVLAQNEAGAITGELIALRRSGATRRAEIRLNGRGTIEIEAPANFPFRTGDQVPVRIVRGRIFQEDAKRG